MAAWPVGDVFSGWAPSDVSAWPRHFVCAHRNGRGRIGYWFYERRHVAVVDGSCGTVLAERRRPLRRELGFRAGREVMADADQTRLAAIFDELDESGHRLFEDGDALASFLARLAYQE